MTDETGDRGPRKAKPVLAWDDFVTDAELIERINVPEKIARDAIKALDKNPGISGFPQKQALWGNRRYWPALRAYFYRASGLNIEPSQQRRAG